MYTIATAGHIDHGKSSLVKALTGTDPDRLPEEKEREMTIELGFASFQLSTGEEVGIVDVPGHERFIKNMISGVGALDMVMFVVAADDGWMPQSEEHLAILRYLGVERGMIVLTKVDMVDPDWKEMVKSDLRTKTKGTFLDGCEIVEFSAQDNRNLDVVKATVERILKSVQREAPGDSARLYIDRVFTIAGTGTVVTGTLREGTFTVGQEVCIIIRRSRRPRSRIWKASTRIWIRRYPACDSLSVCNRWSGAQLVAAICSIRRNNFSHRRYWASS